MKYYTGIGSRETSPKVLQYMVEAAISLAASSYILRSGGAPGADSAFEQGALSVDAPFEIFLPWSPFNDRIADGQRYLYIGGQLREEGERLAKDLHPNWPALGRGARALMTRNVFQVLGPDLKTPSEFILCYTKGGLDRGGTAQALRLAKQYNIPIINYGIYYQ